MGQLGIGFVSSSESAVDFMTPQRVESLSNKKIVEVRAGGYHSMALSATGSIFAFGCGVSGQLGSGAKDPQWTPEEVGKLPQKVMEVDCGQEHTAAITVMGELYVWGSSARGQLGLDHLDNEYSPRLVEPLKGRTLVQVKCGSFHLVVLSSRGKVYLCGNGLDGKLNYGKKFSLLEILQDTPCCRIGAGAESTMLLVGDPPVKPGTLKQCVHHDEDGNQIKMKNAAGVEFVLPRLDLAILIPKVPSGPVYKVNPNAKTPPDTPSDEDQEDDNDAANGGGATGTPAHPSEATSAPSAIAADANGKNKELKSEVEVEPSTHLATAVPTEGVNPLLAAMDDDDTADGKQQPEVTLSM
eukprot:GFYU01014660.1.p1 GENE.GFYU01014660.1~~GFYU01014660.1.p1  ORF type:complete len:394 (-),score=83.44 GFYU01014660.1:43-1104(-)